MIEKELKVKVYHYPDEAPQIPDGKSCVSIYMLSNFEEKNPRNLDDLRWSLYQFEIDTFSPKWDFSWIYATDIFNLVKSLK